MDEIGNIINFDVNENRPTCDNHKVSSNEILNRSSENKLSVDEAAAFFQSSTVTEKQVLTSVNNNCKNGKPNSNFTIADNSTCVSNNSAENITSLSSETGTTKTDSFTSFNQVYETPSNIETSINISANLSSDENPVGNVNFLADALSGEIFSDKQKNLSNIIVQCNETSISQVETVDYISISAEELKDEKSNYMVVQNLVDFSFKEQGNVSDLIENFTAVDSVFKHPETSPNTTLEKVYHINATANKQESTSAELLETDGVKVPNEPATNSHADSGITKAAENCAVVLGDSTNNDSSLCVAETLEKKADGNVVATEEAPGFEPFTLDKSAGNKYGIVNGEGAAFQLSENPSSCGLHEFSPSKLEKVSFDVSCKSLEQFSDPDFAIKLPENPSKELDEISPLNVEKVSCKMSDKPLEKFSDTAFKMPEFPSSKQLDEISPLKAENVSCNISDEPLEQFSNSDNAFKVPETLSSNVLNEVSPLKFENISLNITDKPLQQISDPDVTFKVPENPSSNEQDNVSPLKVENVSFNMSDKPLEQFSDPHFAFKVPENPSSNEDEVSPLKVENVPFDMFDKPLEQCSDPDFAFKVPEVPTFNPLGQLRNPEFVFKMPEKPLTNEDDEQFVDASQFFRDPNSFQFLENIRTSTVQPGPAAPRSSLYVNFDPLHSKFQTNVPRLDNCELISAAVQALEIPTENFEKCNPEVVNKQLVDVAARESIGNILISFDSPKSSASVDSKIPVEIQSPPKMFTEEELQQKLKNYYLEAQEVYLKKQREMEIEIAKRDELLKAQQMVIEEFCLISFNISENNKSYGVKVISLEEENEKLKGDLKTSAEDLQSVENTFTDFYKRYEQCKGMLKTYKDNEEHLKQTILDLQDKAKEQEKMYNMLQKRTEEMLEKANVEVDIAKRSGETQVTVLKAQLKKAEMKISSLESDNKQIKMENSQLGGICDDLMAKVSRS